MSNRLPATSSPIVVVGSVSGTVLDVDVVLVVPANTGPRCAGTVSGSAPTPPTVEGGEVPESSGSDADRKVEPSSSVVTTSDVEEVDPQATTKTASAATERARRIIITLKRTTGPT